MSVVAEAVSKAFGAEKMNYEVLGNGDAHLHWHLFPRNNGDIEKLFREECSRWTPYHFPHDTAETLGKSYHAEMAYENPDGSNIIFDTDFFGKKRPEGNVTPGPFEIMGEKDEKLEFII